MLPVPVWASKSAVTNSTAPSRTRVWLEPLAIIAFVMVVYPLLIQITYSNWLPHIGLAFAMLWILAGRLRVWVVIAFILARMNGAWINWTLFPHKYGYDYPPGILSWRVTLNADWVTVVLGQLDILCALLGVLYLQYRKVRPDQLGETVGMVQLHVAALITAVLGGLKDTFYVLYVHDPLLPHVFSVFFGHFIGVMLVAPLAAMLIERIYRNGLSDVLAEAVLWMFPITAVLLSSASAIGGDGGEILRRLLLVGVVVMAIRHGWRGAAISLAIVSVGLQVEALYDRGLQSTVVIQSFVSVAGVMGLLFGTARDELVGQRIELEGELQDNRELRSQLVSAAFNAQKVEVGERRELALELHDEFGQSLTALQAYLRVAKQNGSMPPFDTLQSLTDQMRNNIQGVLERLRPSVLDEVGLFAAIDRGAVRGVADAAGLEFTTEMQGDARLLSHLADTQELMMYRIVQEAVTNIVRHSGATECSVRLRLSERSGQLWLFADVRDNGVGRVHMLTQGNGLRNLRQRLLAIGGVWHWSELNPGLRMHLLLRQDLGGVATIVE